MVVERRQRLMMQRIREEPKSITKPCTRFALIFLSITFMSCNMYNGVFI